MIPRPWQPLTDKPYSVTNPGTVSPIQVQCHQSGYSVQQRCLQWCTVANSGVYSGVQWSTVVSTVVYRGYTVVNSGVQRVYSGQQWCTVVNSGVQWSTEGVQWSTVVYSGVTVPGGVSHGTTRARTIPITRVHPPHYPCTPPPCHHTAGTTSSHADH